MRRVIVLAVLMVAGCGAELGRIEAERACPTLTAVEFDVLYSAARFARKYGDTRQAALARVLPTCSNNLGFDRDSECRSCIRAITDAVYGR